MPKSKRDRMKGSIATAHLDLERALVQLCEVSGQFESVHPELDDGLRIAGTLIMQAQTVLETFYIKCWGSLPDNWERARNLK